MQETGENMRIRPYIEDKDYPYLEKWIDNERAHAMWCGNYIHYPMTKENLHRTLRENERDWTDSAYVATEDDGTPAGFFCYCIDVSNNTGFLKYVIVDNTKRGRGYGERMLRLALQYAFTITGAQVVQLNVFPENLPAKRCYEKAGFKVRQITKGVFSYRDELWDRCNMAAAK